MPHSHHIVNAVGDAPKFHYSDEQVKQFLDGIYDETYTDRELPQDLYEAIADYLKNAVYKAFNGTALSDFADTQDYALITELRENIYMFSAAKTYQQVREISSLLVDADGNTRSQAEFNKMGRETYDLWNDDYGRSEYNTAFAQASMANKWDDIEKNKDILPMLSYSTIGDACDICAPLDGFTAPVDDDKWDTIYPPNHFNCMCVVTQDDEDTEATPSSEADNTFNDVTDKMSEVFKMNSGKDKVIFSDEHPYFDVAAKDKDFAKDNFGFPIPEKD